MKKTAFLAFAAETKDDIFIIFVICRT